MPHACKWGPCPWIGLLILLVDTILPDPRFLPGVPSGEQQRGAFPDSIHSRWRQGALQAQPHILQRIAGCDGCGPFLSESLRCITWNTRGPSSPDRRIESSKTLGQQQQQHYLSPGSAGKGEFLQAIQVLAPRFRLFGTFLLDNENAGGSAICIHRDLLPEKAIVTHMITCQSRDHLVNIRSGRHNLVIVNVHFEPELTSRQLRGRLRLIHPHWPAYPCGVGVILVISTSAIRKKDDLMFGTSHSPMATREKLLCSILSFATFLRLSNLTSQEETLQPL